MEIGIGNVETVEGDGELMRGCGGVAGAKGVGGGRGCVGRAVMVERDACGRSNRVQNVRWNKQAFTTHDGTWPFW